MNGIPMHERLRKGMETQERMREIAIYDLEIIQIKRNKVKFWVECSKGAYIRTLCHDWGERLGAGAHMSFLLRLSVGPFVLEHSHTLEEIRERGEALLQPKECLVEQMRRLQATEEEMEWLRHGRAIRVREGRVLEAAADHEPGAGLTGGVNSSQDHSGDRVLWVAAMTPLRRLAAVGKLAAAEGGFIFKPVKVFDGVDA
jgi:tRNA U55 pseudouridine synthase TruB